MTWARPGRIIVHVAPFLTSAGELAGRVLIRVAIAMPSKTGSSGNNTRHASPGAGPAIYRQGSCALGTVVGGSGNGIERACSVRFAQHQTTCFIFGTRACRSVWVALIGICH